MSAVLTGIALAASAIGSAMSKAAQNQKKSIGQKSSSDDFGKGVSDFVKSVRERYNLSGQQQKEAEETQQKNIDNANASSVTPTENKVSFMDRAREAYRDSDYSLV